jgi:hypothetical protein
MELRNNTTVRISGLLIVGLCYLLYNPALHLMLIAIFR